MTDHIRNTPQFFLTAPSPCPYLPGQEERKVFTHLVGARAPQLNDILTHGGFRRSQSIAYRPACETCRACVSVRVRAAEFSPSRSFRRILKDNADLDARMIAPVATDEHYALFRRYVAQRHADGGMAEMTALDFTQMVEDTHVRTQLVEYRRVAEGEGPGELIACALTDLLADGLSMAYSFYDPTLEGRSLGTFVILDHIDKVNRLGLPFIYLGYWVESSKKMAYKARFQPQDRLGMLSWQPFFTP